MFSHRLPYSIYRCMQAALLLVGVLSSAGSYAQTKLVFGVYTADKPTAMVKAYRPILSALASSLSDRLQDDISIKMQVASSYQKGIDALATGSVDFAMLGPASYLEALDNQPALKILALDSKDGSKFFKGIIAVAVDSDIESISDLKGKRFAFGNEQSTIGRYLAQALLKQNGIRAQNLESFDYLGRHDRVAHSVANGNHDAGALKEGTYTKLVKKGLKLRTLTTVELVNRPWVASAELELPLYTALKESMLELKAPKAFKSMGRKMFVEGDDSDFIEVRTAIKDNAAFFATEGQPTTSSGE